MASRTEADVLAARYRDAVQLLTAGNGYAALLEIQKVRRTLERIELRAVIQAREKGATWAQVGAAIGTTKQGAQQRYGKTA